MFILAFDFVLDLWISLTMYDSRILGTKIDKIYEISCLASDPNKRCFLRLTVGNLDHKDEYITT